MNRMHLVAAALSGLLGSACEPATQAPPAAPDSGGSQGGAPPPSGATAPAQGATAPAQGATAPAQGATAPSPGGAMGQAGFEQGNAAFAQALYGKLAAGAKGNLFFSPASISTALGMAYAGARGETAAQMAATLRFSVPPAELHAGFAAQTARLTAGTPKGPEIRIANRMWGQAGLPVEADFQRIAKEQYGAGWELADFKGAAEPARGKINQWVSDQTNAKIKDLLPPGSLTPLTRLVITNAIYFKGKWATPFEKDKTKSEPFTLAGGATARVPMMRRVLRAGFAETADALACELQYEGEGAGRTLSMVVIAPKAADGLGQVEQRIAAGGLSEYVSGLAPQQVDVALPRFKMTSEHDLGGTLKAMGMPLAFDEAKADFSGITKAEPLFITKVAHKAFVEVNEEGTEAAAATGVVVGTRSLPPPPKVFRADRPFAFVLRDATTGTVLFMGRVADPR